MRRFLARVIKLILINSQLRKMNVKYKSVSLLQNKDGVIVARVFCDDKTYILKLFKNPEFRREIENYRVLSGLRVPVLKIINSTDISLLMEDINESSIYRLGTNADMDNVDVAVQLAKWYRTLHDSGEKYVNEHSSVLYDETDYITRENIEFIKRSTKTENLGVWKLIDDNFECIINRIKALKRTLTYNDFYYTNLIVAKDYSSAFMFDYNLLGKGYAYSDIRNVCYSLSDDAGKAFMEAYGDFDKKEIAVDDVVSVLTTLYLACKRAVFPEWADSALQELKSDGYIDKVEQLIYTDTAD